MKATINTAKEKMEKCVAALENEFATIRAGRANPAVLDKITVDYYGVPTQINAMAAVSVAEARILVITPWDASTLKSIEKAILASDIGITPTNDGKAIRIVFPQLTEERRKELCKQIKACESQGDSIATQIFETLYKTKRITFDRVDIQQLASMIESFLDLIHDSAKKLVIYHPKHIDHVWVEIGESIQEDAKIITGIIKELGNLDEKAKFLMQKCYTIKEIEHEVDDLYECYMSNLFEVEKDSIEITKNKNIIETLEDTTDMAKEIADGIKTIIVKLA